MTLFINRVLHLFEVMHIKNNRRAVFLTFDDGPEPGITEFVLEELQKHQFKATFFCRGDNAESYPHLLERIINEGHSIGNHTYSHLDNFETSAKDYVADVKRADYLLRTKIFRPPKGRITLPVFLRLFKRYRIVYWNVMSGDSDLQRFDKAKCQKRLVNKTKSGSVILFHFCHRHEKETRQLLPDYLNWLDEWNYHSEPI